MGLESKEGRQLVAIGLDVLTVLSILPLLRWAARRDLHYHTNFGAGNDELIRTNAGLFLIVGVVACIPALIAAFVARPRFPAITLIVICMLMAGVCEFVVSAAPSPWF